MNKYLFWALTPVWALAAVLFIAVVFIGTGLWLLFDSVHRSSAIAVFVIGSLLLAVGLSTPSPWSPWQTSVMDCSLVAGTACSVVWALQAFDRVPRPVFYTLLMSASAYVVAKAGYVGSVAQPSSLSIALVVLAAVLPVAQAAALARLWRGANAEACAIVGREILQEFVETPFSQALVEGLHTIEFHPKTHDRGFQQGDTAAAAGVALPVVFLHGYAAGSAYFAYNFDSAVSVPGTRVFAVDWRGCGASTRETFTPRSTEEAEAWFLDSLERWRVAQGFDRMILVGHSLGGYLSSAYATLHPEHVAGLVLVSPVGVGGDAKPELPGHRGVSPRPDGKKTAPPRIPKWVLPLVSALWNGGVTPGVMLRALGPFGLCFSRRAAAGRVSRMTLEEPLSPKQLAVLGTYFYHSNAASGSGEHALRHLLGPGAWAYKPIGARLVAAARRPAGDPLRLHCRVSFIYGATHVSSQKGSTPFAALNPLVGVVSCRTGCNHGMVSKSPSSSWLWVCLPMCSAAGQQDTMSIWKPQRTSTLFSAQNLAPLCAATPLFHQ
jgi:pimeloyl-ACP methyl ester carboxylesterase